MESDSLLVVAMAEQCKRLLLESNAPQVGAPKAVQPKHLLWMCDQIVEHAEHGHPTKLHRWIGFIQCGLLVHGILDLAGAKAMFDKAKLAHGDSGEDLLDHLDVNSSFSVDIGGQG